MKKLILLLFSAISINCVSQNVKTMTPSGQSLNGGTTKYVTYQTTVFNEQVSFQAVVTKVGGTVALKGYLQSSNDGVNYIDVNTDTLKCTNQSTNTKIWVVGKNNQTYYRIKFVGTSTDTVTINGYMLSSTSYSSHLALPMKSSYGFTSDTCTNSGTTYVQLEVKNSYKTLAIQPVVTKISGTVGGTVTLQGSIDGRNFVTVSSSYSDYQTLSCSNTTTNTKHFVVTGSPYRYFRLSYTGTGTMSATIKGYMVINK